MAKKNERIYDELLSFLGDPMFQIPVRTFMDENCLIFDPCIEPSDDHKMLHSRYKRLVDALLDSFCKDMNISVDDAIKGIDKLSAVSDLKEVFHTLFDQVQAMTDFETFCQMMIKRNIMIQEQVLVMIIAATGGLPLSLLAPDGSKIAGDQTAGAVSAPNFDKEEDDVLKQVMESSKKEASVARQSAAQDAQEMEKTLEISRHQAAVLQEERKKLEENMKKLALGNAPVIASIPVPASKQPEPVRLQSKVQLPPSLTNSEKQVSGSDAAQQWLASAQADAKQSSTHSAFAASLAKLSPDEIKQRQDFLRQQRDKLLAMKKEAREKQLGEETSNKPQRPQSARAARAAMSGTDIKTSEDEKKLAMRKAIAAKLKAEVIGDKY